MTAVGAIAGLGLARNALATDVVLEIVSWWIVAPLVAFWVSGVVGRYAYEAIDERLALGEGDTSVVAIDRSGVVPTPQLPDETTPREATGAVLVVGIACFMAFSAGASNVANAVAPLVGSGQLSMDAGILLAGGAIGLGAVTIARRTLDTMGDGLTTLPLAAALVVAVVSASLVTGLSAIGIPASFVVIATMSTVGLGWGRATRAESALAIDADDVVEGVTDPAPGVAVDDLYRPWATLRVVVLQNAVPAVATAGAYLLFSVW
jgi:PiT family inorganic phosphate transporter